MTFQIHEAFLIKAALCACMNSVNTILSYPSIKNQGFFPSIPSPGYSIGTSITSLKTSKLPSLFESFELVVSDVEGVLEDEGILEDVGTVEDATGMITPHSQFLHESLGFFVSEDLTSFPHADSEQLAEPT